METAQLEKLRDWIKERILNILPDTWTNKNKKSWIYNSRYHILEVQAEANRIAKLVNLSEQESLILEISALLHDTGYYEGEPIIDYKNDKKTKYIGAENKEIRSIQLVYTMQETGVLNNFMPQSEQKEFREAVQSNILGASRITDDVMHGESKTPLFEIIRKPQEIDSKIILSIAEGFQMAHPAHPFYLSRLLETPGFKEHFNIKEFMPDLIADVEIPENIYKYSIRTIPKLKDTKEAQTFSANIVLRNKLRYEIRGQNQRKKYQITFDFLNTYRTLVPEIDEHPSFWAGVPEDLPTKVLAEI